MKSVKSKKNFDLEIIDLSTPQTPSIDHLNTERYQSLVNTLNGYEEFILDANGNIISSNLEAVAITGYEEWEVIGKNISLFYSVDERFENRPESDLAATRIHQHYTLSEIKYKKRNTPFWASIKISLLKQDINSIKCFRLTIKDTTHLIVNDSKIKFIQEEYAGLFNNSFVGIFKFSLRNATILSLNEKAMQILQARPEDTSFKNFFLNHSAFDNLIAKLAKNRKVDNFEFQLNSSNSTERWLSISCNYFQTEAIVEGILLDESDRRRELLESKKIKAQLDNFLYHASHDLRSPLTTIMGLVHLLKLECPTDQVISYSNLINERVHHLDDILHDLVSVVYNNSASVAIEAISFSELIDPIIKGVSVSHPRAKIVADVKDSGEFFSDKVRVTTIIKSLLTNSVKQQIPEDFDLTIVIKVSVNHAVCEISVQDNGVQIKEENLEFLFNEFYKASTSSLGSGLNLFIAKSMVDTLQGAIRVDITKTSGFIVTLPSLACHNLNNKYK